MQVTPRTEREIMELNLWPAGVYSFEIAEAKESISQSGNEMIKLTLNVYNDEGKVKKVFDYLMNTEVMAFKLRHCSEVCGLLADYENGTLSDYKFDGKTGHLKLDIRKDKNGQYPDQNAVIDYVVKRENVDLNAPISKPVSRPAPALDDDIPF